MSTKFDTSRVQPQTTEPQLTSFTGVGEADSFALPGGSKCECAKILTELNAEAARYCALATALGTNIDADYLRRRLKKCRKRVWDNAKEFKSKLIPLLRRKKIKMESCEDLERMYRVFCACLEFLEQQYHTTFLLQNQFSLHAENIVFINTGMSETSIPKKGPDKQADRCSGNDIQSIRSICSDDLRNSEKDDINCLQKEINDIQVMVYTLNQSIAIQSWEVDPDLETEKFTVAIDGNGSSRHSSINADSISESSDHKRLRCVSIVILTMIIVIVGGIVGILMGVLD